MELVKKGYSDSKVHKVKPIRLLDIYWSASQKAIAACCQDMKIAFWTANNKFQGEYCFPTDKFGIQLKIYFIEITQTWITVSQHNKIVEWRFINQIDSSNTSNILKNNDNQMNQTLGSGSLFTYSSIAEGTVWPFKANGKISIIKEIQQLKKLLISSFDRTITVWSPLRNQPFVTIEIPSGFSSAHSLAFSTRMNFIFSAGFDQCLMIWALDEINQDYNKIGKIEVSEPGVSISALECFDEYGLLITLDESGMMRCWDLEKWRIAYRFNLGCQIKNTISQVVRLDLGRFIVVTSRLHVFEFPTKHPRKVKSKFQPLKEMLYNMNKNQIIVGSANEIFFFNINNAIVEEKYNMENSTLSSNMLQFQFYPGCNQVFSINSQGQINQIIHKGDKSEEPAKETSQQINNVDDIKQMINKKAEDSQHTHFDHKMQNCSYNWTNEIFYGWNDKEVKIFKGVLNPLNSFKFQKVRSIDFQGDQIISNVKVVCERNVIAILMKSGIIYFVSFSELKQVGVLCLNKYYAKIHRQNSRRNSTLYENSNIQDYLEINDFFICPAYDAIILFDANYDLLFISHTRFHTFELLFKISATVLLGEKIVYKEANQHYFDNVSF